MSYDHESRHCAASFRSSPHYAKQSHNVRPTQHTRTTHTTHTHTRDACDTHALAYVWVGVGAQIFTFEEGAKPKELRTLYSTSTQTLLSRSTLFSFVDGAYTMPRPYRLHSLLFYSQPLTLFHCDGRCPHCQAMTWPSADGSCWPLAPRPPTRYLLTQFII